MFYDGEEEEPASVMVTIHSGQNYDIKNLPGHVRKRLIENGEASVETFVQADNMPGYKLKKMRDNLRKNVGAQVNIPADLDINKLTVGSLVSYRKVVTEAKKINVEKGLVYINIKGSKKGWIGVDKLRAVNIPANEEE